MPGPAQKERYTISELAEEFGITTRAIRFYESKKLLEPTRKGLQRIYSPRDRARLFWIMRGKRVGFTLDEIREMLDLYDHTDGGAEQLRVTLAKSRERIVALERQREDIESAILDLRQGCAEIEERLSHMEEDVAGQSSSESSALEQANR